MSVKNNKKIVTIPLIVIASIVAAVLIFGLVMGLVRAPLAPKFADPASIQIITSGGYSAAGNSSAIEVDKSADTANYDKLLKAVKGASDYSQLSTAMERKWFKSYELVTVKNSDGDTEKKELSVSDVNAIVASESEGKYLIVLRYLSDKQSITIDGTEIEYDSVYIVVKDNVTGFATFNMYFIDFVKLSANVDDIADEDAEEYVAYEIKAWAKQSQVVKAVKEIKESR